MKLRDKKQPQSNWRLDINIITGKMLCFGIRNDFEMTKMLLKL